MSLRDVPREMRELPIALLDPPQLDARIDRDEAKLEELTNDVARRGVILPLAVVCTGERFEIVDGQSRHIAATRAQLSMVPCVIYPSKDVALEGVKYAANLFRLDMSAAEEAKFFHELYHHECGGDIDRLCALVGRKFPYVSSRLELLEGDEQVFEAVRAEKITLGVAAQLNQIPKEDYRRYYLHLAIRDGATVAAVTGWVTEWKKLYLDTPAPASSAPAASGAIVASTFNPHRCEICGKVDPRFIPEQISVHTHCKIAILEPLLEAYRGGTGTPG